MTAITKTILTAALAGLLPAAAAAAAAPEQGRRLRANCQRVDTGVSNGKGLDPQNPSYDAEGLSLQITHTF